VVDGRVWASVAREALDFPIPLTPLGAGVELLELFHGPTLSFKDVGARFLAGTLAALGGGPRTILVATSGDTGGAVADAVARVRGLRAVILFPRGRVSGFQRRQFTTLGDRVLAVEVEGVFDECQTLARQALGDAGARERYGLLSANSINPGRLLPQVFYYLHLARLQGWGGRGPGASTAVVVPSGNLGNLTAGVLAGRAGAPLGRLVAACNRNDALVRFQRDGRTRTVPVYPTESSAMDVGAPSNLERLEALFEGDAMALARAVPAFRADSREARDAMRWAWDRHGVLLDPHTAVGVAVARRLPPGGPPGATVLATAHPAKFPEAVRAATGQTPPVPAGQPEDGAREEIVPLEAGLPELLDLLREWVG
jgi:threonine synthase